MARKLRIEYPGALRHPPSTRLPRSLRYGSTKRRDRCHELHKDRERAGAITGKQFSGRRVLCRARFRPDKVCPNYLDFRGPRKSNWDGITTEPQSHRDDGSVGGNSVIKRPCACLNSVSRCLRGCFGRRGMLLRVAVTSNIADAFGNIGQGILPIPLVFDKNKTVKPLTAQFRQNGGHV